jgi:diguanylate cyclase (GGDEF)-like protein
MGTKRKGRKRVKPINYRTKYLETVKRCTALAEENATLRENLRLLDDLRQRMEHLSERAVAINYLSQELNTLDVDKITSVAIHKISDLIGARYASLFLYERATDELVLRSHNHPNELPGRVVIKEHRNTIMGYAIRERKNIYIEDIDEYERVNKIRFERTFADKYMTKSCICAPLIAGDLIIGVLNFADKKDGTSFSLIDDVPTVEQFIYLVTLSLRNCQLYREVEQQARIDVLTQLANYRVFQEALQHEVFRAIRYNRALSLILLDIDNFKEINDTYGHLTGDYILREIGELIRKTIRGGDIPARYGGDEIAILLPETNLEGSIALANRLLTLVRSHHFFFDGKTVPIFISIGVTTYASGMTPVDFVSAVDRALYQAKQRGRNRLSVLTTPVEQPPFLPLDTG